MDVEVNDGGTHGIAIKLNGNRIPIKKTPLSKIGGVLEAFTIVASVCPLEKARFPKEIEKKPQDPNWTLEDFEYLYDNTSHIQRIFLRETTSSKVPVSTKHIVKVLKKNGYTDSVPQSISGLRSGLTKLFKKMGKAEIVNRKWDEEEWMNYYEMFGKYKDLFKQVDKDRED